MAGSLAAVVLLGLAFAAVAAAGPKPRPYQGPEIPTPDAERCDLLDTVGLPLSVAERLLHGRRPGHRHRPPAQPRGRVDDPQQGREPDRPDDYNRNDGFSPGQHDHHCRCRGSTPRRPSRKTGAGADRRHRALTTTPTSRSCVIDADTRRAPPDLGRARRQPRRPRRALDLIIRPRVNFAEGQRYIVALRNLRDAGGEPIAPGDRLPRLPRPPDHRAAGSRRRRAHMEGIFDDPAARRDPARQPLPGLGLHRRERAQPDASAMLHIRDDAFAQLGDTDLADLSAGQLAARSTVTEVTELQPSAPSATNIARAGRGQVTGALLPRTRRAARPARRFNYGPDGLPAQRAAPRRRTRPRPASSA